jgi:hypothetical protein
MIASFFFRHQNIIRRLPLNVTFLAYVIRAASPQVIIIFLNKLDEYLDRGNRRPV